MECVRAHPDPFSRSWAFTLFIFLVGFGFIGLQYSEESFRCFRQVFSLILFVVIVSRSQLYTEHIMHIIVHSSPSLTMINVHECTTHQFIPSQKPHRYPNPSTSR